MQQSATARFLNALNWCEFWQFVKSKTNGKGGSNLSDRTSTVSDCQSTNQVIRPVDAQSRTRAVTI